MSEKSSLLPPSRGAVPSRRKTNEGLEQFGAERGGARREGGAVVSLPFLLDALLFVAAGVHVEVEVVPVVAGREGDGLAQGEAHGVDDALPARLPRAHAHRGGTAGRPQQVRRGGEVMELPVVQDALPDGVAELLRDLEAHQILQGKGVWGLARRAGPPGGEHRLWDTVHRGR